MCKGEWPLLLHTKCLILGNKIWFPSLEPLGKSPPDFDRNRELIHIYLTSCSDQSSQDWVGTWVCMLFFQPWIKFLVKQSPLCSKTPAFPGLCVCGLSFCPTNSSVKSFGLGGLQDTEFACFLPVGKKKVFVITCGGRYLVLSQRKETFALSVKFCSCCRLQT